MSSYAANLFSDLQEALTLHNREGQHLVRGPFVITIGFGSRERYLLENLDSTPLVRPLTDAEPASGPELVYKSQETFQQIFERKLRPDRAWAKGDLTIRGNLAALGELKQLFAVLRKYRQAKEKRKDEENPKLSIAESASPPDAPVATAPATPATAAVAPPASKITPVRLTESFSPQHPTTPVVSELRVRDKSEWEPDTENCALCSSGFSFLNRQHHCRFCGKCLCDACSRIRHQGLRICDLCAKQLVTNIAVANTPVPTTLTTPVPQLPPPSLLRSGSATRSTAGSVSSSAGPAAVTPAFSLAAPPQPKGISSGPPRSAAALLCPPTVIVSRWL
jgi:FYVE zinc finger